MLSGSPCRASARASQHGKISGDEPFWTLYVDPKLKLVMVQIGANATAEAGKTSLGADRDEF